MEGKKLEARVQAKLESMSHTAKDALAENAWNAKKAISRYYQFAKDVQNTRHTRIASQVVNRWNNLSTMPSLRSCEFCTSHHPYLSAHRVSCHVIIRTTETCVIYYGLYFQDCLSQCPSKKGKALKPFFNNLVEIEKRIKQHQVTPLVLESIFSNVVWFSHVLGRHHLNGITFERFAEYNPSVTQIYIGCHPLALSCSISHLDCAFLKTSVVLCTLFVPLYGLCLVFTSSTTPLAPSVVFIHALILLARILISLIAYGTGDCMIIP